MTAKSTNLTIGLWAVSSVEDEEPVTASKREESQSTRLKDNLHQKQSLNSNELNPSLDSTDAMLNTLLPDYFASQQSGFNSTKAEETLPSTSLTLGNRMDVEESEKGQLRSWLRIDQRKNFAFNNQVHY